MKVFSPSDFTSRRTAVELFCAAVGGGGFCAPAIDANEIQIDAETNSVSANVRVQPGMCVVYRKSVGRLQPATNGLVVNGLSKREPAYSTVTDFARLRG